MDLRTRNVTISGPQLMELLAAAFADGVTHGAQHGANRLDTHPITSGDFDAAAQWSLELVERTIPAQDIWITSR